MDNGIVKIVDVGINEIIPNRFQPRRQFDEDEIMELSESIRKHGIIQPLVVRPIGDKYEIIAGERRYKASVLAGLETVPVIIKNLTDKDSAELAIIENIQRKNLSAIEEALSYKKILDMGYLTQEDLAYKLGKSQLTIANKIRLLNLSDEVQEALLDNKISERHARSLLRLPLASQQNEMLNKIISERLTVRKTDEEIDKMKELESGEINMNGESTIDTNSQMDSLSIAPNISTMPTFDMFGTSNNVQPEVAQPQFTMPQAPAQPEVEQPQFTMPQVPVQPEVEQPQFTMPQAPVQAEVEQPQFTMPQAPAQPEVEQPQFTMPQAPAQPEVEQPQFMMPQTPVQPEVAQPQFTMPQAPAQPEVEQPQFMMPQVPVQPEVAQPQFTMPQVPAQPEVEQPQFTMPQVPAQPEVTIPTSPIIEQPEVVSQQEASMPEINIQPQPETPAYQSETIAEPVSTTQEPIIITDYTKQYDPIMPQAPQPIEKADFKVVIDAIRECSAKIEQYGYVIDVEEYDLANLYQVVFKVEK